MSTIPNLDIDKLDDTPSHLIAARYLKWIEVSNSVQFAKHHYEALTEIIKAERAARFHEVHKARQRIAELEVKLLKREAALLAIASGQNATIDYGEQVFGWAKNLYYRKLITDDDAGGPFCNLARAVLEGAQAPAEEES